MVGQLLVIYWAPMQKIFQTEALSASDLGGTLRSCVPSGFSSSLATIETRVADDLTAFVLSRVHPLSGLSAASARHLPEGLCQFAPRIGSNTELGPWGRRVWTEKRGLHGLKKKTFAPYDAE